MHKKIGKMESNRYSSSSSSTTTVCICKHESDIQTGQELERTENDSHMMSESELGEKRKNRKIRIYYFCHHFEVAISTSWNLNSFTLSPSGSHHSRDAYKFKQQKSPRQVGRFDSIDEDRLDVCEWKSKKINANKYRITLWVPTTAACCCCPSRHSCVCVCCLHTTNMCEHSNDNNNNFGYGYGYDYSTQWEESMPLVMTRELSLWCNLRKSFFFFSFSRLASASASVSAWQKQYGRVEALCKFTWAKHWIFRPYYSLQRLGDDGTRNEGDTGDGYFHLQFSQTKRQWRNFLVAFAPSVFLGDGGGGGDRTTLNSRTALPLCI